MEEEDNSELASFLMRLCKQTDVCHKSSSSPVCAHCCSVNITWMEEEAHSELVSFLMRLCKQTDVCHKSSTLPVS